MDWTGCELVQEDDLYVSGAPAFKSHPRVMVEPIVDNLEDGLNPERVAALYDVPLNEVLVVYEFYKAKMGVPSVR